MYLAFVFMSWFCHKQDKENGKKIQHDLLDWVGNYSLLFHVENSYDICFLVATISSFS